MNKLVVLVFAVLISTTSFSQGLDFGIKVGANFSSISDATGFSNKTGFTGGIFAALKFGDKFAIQPELLYSQQGAEVNGKNIDLTYVNVPVVIKYYLFKGLNLQAGPQFGFVVDDNVKEVFKNINILGEAKPGDVSAVAGLGYDLPFGLRVDGRYNFGLTDTFTERQGKNSVITLSVGYSFL